MPVTTATLGATTLTIFTLLCGSSAFCPIIWWSCVCGGQYDEGSMALLQFVLNLIQFRSSEILWHPMFLEHVIGFISDPFTSFSPALYFLHRVVSCLATAMLLFSISSITSTLYLLLSCPYITAFLKASASNTLLFANVCQWRSSAYQF